MTKNCEDSIKKQLGILTAVQRKWSCESGNFRSEYTPYVPIQENSQEKKKRSEQTQMKEQQEEPKQEFINNDSLVLNPYWKEPRLS